MDSSTVTFTKIASFFDKGDPGIATLGLGAAALGGLVKKRIKQLALICLLIL